MGTCNLYIPAKRRLKTTDPFFSLGNAEAGIDHINKQLVTSRSLLAAQQSADGDSILMGTKDLLVESGILRHPIFCNSPPCLGSAAFPTTLAFEKHYDQVHQNMCSTCSAIFPSSHWLDLHIQELHDAFFSARIAHGDKAFQCFLPSCPETFACSERRKLHMVGEHQFPRSFDWMLVRNGNRPVGGHASHAVSSSQQNSENSSMDVDQLSTAFKRSFRVGVPKSISFGQQQEP
ncbi:hypothetical protein IW140_003964 [Coemansia sp. RSA 1813]|nr:hypothetical protein EV178_003862 [Coemansia sp. RSA 1646]KAJ1769871.1 hypothetical protein LPJ74_003660 [Coemansia sp. RSA 1843]KAJ2088550.1 hypothetical protein IW138_004139 [Coemansia sp. RSA 986]KAJ2213431.1 hypothetical protein EV179_003849 [Coemansia sp. RSA 487]KAJ2568327.1 hypothetical protein IW140_003964 [Coemansia sp. RSA 1813]